MFVLAAAEQKADPGAEPWQGQPRSPPLKFGGGSRAGGRGLWGSCTQAVPDAPSPKAKPWSRAAFVQPLQKALTPPLRSLFAATRARRGSPSWSSPCRSEQPSSAAFCRVRTCAGGLGSPLPDFARALGDPGRSSSSAGLPKSRCGKVLLAKSSLGRPRWVGRCRVPSRSTVALSQDVLGEQQRHGASPRVVGGLSLRGEKPIRGYPLGGRGLGVTSGPVSCCRALQAQIDHGEPGVGTEAPGGRRAGAGQGIAVPKGSPMSPSESLLPRPRRGGLEGRAASRGG